MHPGETKIGSTPRGSAGFLTVGWAFVPAMVAALWLAANPCPADAPATQPAVEPASADGQYEIELKLIGPPSTPALPDYETGIMTARQTVRGTQWPLGEKGVGELRLAPGGLYSARVLVRSPDGQLFARSRHRVIWVPWEHRASELPAGSVPQATAAWLLSLDEEGQKLPKRLDLKAPGVAPATGASRDG